MSRRLHLWISLLLGLLLTISAVSGLLLAIQPAGEHLRAPLAESTSVADVAALASQHVNGIERISHTASGELRVDYRNEQGEGTVRVDPLTGDLLGDYDSGSVIPWVRSLHRELFIGTPGRVAMGLSALGMLLVSVSGLLLLKRKLGGWRGLLRVRSAERGMARWHTEAGRLAMPGLLLLAATGLYMSAVSLELIGDGSELQSEYPAVAQQLPRSPIAGLPALRTMPLAELRELEFPAYDDDAFYSVRTTSGEGFIDAGSGEMVNFMAYGPSRQLSELVMYLHTGAAGSWLTFYLAFSVATVPLLMLSGLPVWWRKRRRSGGTVANAPAEQADTVVLVGSQSNGTWGFAEQLCEQLMAQGRCVHLAAMNDLREQYPCARTLLLLTSTYGDGQAPASAESFLDRLPACHFERDIGFAVLGFGDSRYRHFCAFAEQVDEALLARSLRPLLPLHRVNRSSADDFSAWGRDLAGVLMLPLELDHGQTRTETGSMRLISRQVYGEQTQTPAAVLRFQVDGCAALSAFEPGDLIAISPAESEAPRLYSIASSADDRFLEICVRRHLHGLCSRYLYDLPLDAPVQAYVQAHPGFRPDAGMQPVMLVGVGTGIGPLVGFIRKNHKRRPIHLFWGGRDEASDFLYQDELNEYLADGRLSQLHTAFSEGEDPMFVQERIRRDGQTVGSLLQSGGQILICGSRQMADGVKQVLDGLLCDMSLSVEQLRKEGRYREDVFG